MIPTKMICYHSVQKTIFTFFLTARNRYAKHKSTIREQRHLCVTNYKLGTDI